LQNIQEYKETIPIYTKMEQWRYHYTQELLNSTKTDHYMWSSFTVEQILRFAFKWHK